MKTTMLLALVRAQIDGDAESFKKVALQIAAQEASAGHSKVATEIRYLIDKVQVKQGQHVGTQKPVTPITRPNGELGTLLQASYPEVKFRDMVFEEETYLLLKRILKEQQNRQLFSSYGLQPKRKFLLVGPPGCGKTSTAKMLAGELGRPLFVVRLEGLLSRYLGETSAHLSAIFDAMKKTIGVYLFDEFDSIGTFRGDTRDIGEVRRVLSTFLQLIENDGSDSIIVAATNYEHMLDNALFRRFDDVVEFPRPSVGLLAEFLKRRLQFVVNSDADISWERVAKEAEGLSFADMERASADALKAMLMNGQTLVTEALLTQAIHERLLVHRRVFSRMKELGDKE